MAKALCVNPDIVHLIWPKASHWINAALERGDMGTFKSVETDVLERRALLWLVWLEPNIEGAAVTQIEKTESSKVCTIVACGGDGMRTWVHLIGKLEDYARDQQCDCVRIVGRKGWQRVLPQYAVAKIILERQL